MKRLTEDMADQCSSLFSLLAVKKQPSVQGSMSSRRRVAELIALVNK